MAIPWEDHVKYRKYINLLSLNNIYFLDQCSFTLYYEFTFDYVMEHIFEFQKVYDLLEDDLSKKFMTAFLNSSISSDSSYFLKNNYTVDNDYFQKDIMKLEDNEVFVDCGACDGSTVKEFIENMKKNKVKYSKIFALEPDNNNFISLKKEFEDNSSIICINKAAYSEKSKFKMEGERESSTLVKVFDDLSNLKDAYSDNIVHADTLDNIVKDEKVTFLAMDVEGSELEALKGAADIIKKYKPKLAISAYHKKEDLYTLILYIKKICPEYKIYMRALVPTCFDFTIFAII